MSRDRLKVSKSAPPTLLDLVLEFMLRDIASILGLKSSEEDER